MIDSEHKNQRSPKDSGREERIALFCSSEALLGPFSRSSVLWGDLRGVEWIRASHHDRPSLPEDFPSGPEAQAPLAFYELLGCVMLIPAVFAVRGLSGYFNTYLINYCGVRVLEKIRIRVFDKLQRLPLSLLSPKPGGPLEAALPTTPLSCKTQS